MEKTQKSKLQNIFNKHRIWILAAVLVLVAVAGVLIVNGQNSTPKFVIDENNPKITEIRDKQAAFREKYPVTEQVQYDVTYPTYSDDEMERSYHQDYFTKLLKEAEVKLAETVEHDDFTMKIPVGWYNLDEENISSYGAIQELYRPTTSDSFSPIVSVSRDVFDDSFLLNEQGCTIFARDEMNLDNPESTFAADYYDIVFTTNSNSNICIYASNGMFPGKINFTMTHSKKVNPYRDYYKVETTFDATHNLVPEIMAVMNSFKLK